MNSPVRRCILWSPPVVQGGLSSNTEFLFLEYILWLRNPGRRDRQHDRDFRTPAIRMNIHTAFEMADTLSHSRDPYAGALRVHSVHLFGLYSRPLLLTSHHNILAIPGH